MSSPPNDAQKIALLERELRQMQKQCEAIERQQQFRMGAMQKLHSQLEASVLDLREALAAAERASRTKDSLLANLSHELRTPLHGIHSAGELLIKAPLGADEGELASLIVSSTAQLRSRLEILMDFASIEAGNLDLESKSVDLGELTTRALLPHHAMAAEKGLALVVEIDPDLPRCILSDRERLTQVLDQLVDNGVKFTRNGSVQVRIWASQCNAGFCVDVRDTGCGIPAEEHDRVFEAFAQVDEARSRESDGAGIGLALTRRIVVAMGGWIELESTPGEGTRVLATLPLEAEAAAEPEAESEDGLDDLRILVVDDNPVNRLLARRMLEGLGCLVELASGGEEALEGLDPKDMPDLILMDCSMPGMDGYETTREIKRIPGQASETPIVALTAHALPQDRQRAFESGMCGFLTKPVSQAELGEALLRLRRSA